MVTEKIRASGVGRKMFLTSPLFYRTWKAFALKTLPAILSAIEIYANNSAKQARHVPLSVLISVYAYRAGHCVGPSTEAFDSLCT